MTRYKLVLGMTVPTLELEINQMVSDEPSAKLINALSSSIRERTRIRSLQRKC